MHLNILLVTMVTTANLGPSSNHIPEDNYVLPSRYLPNEQRNVIITDPSTVIIMDPCTLRHMFSTKHLTLSDSITSYLSISGIYHISHDGEDVINILILLL